MPTLGLLSLLVAAPLPPPDPAVGEVAAINAALDDLHKAASVADEARYFNHFAPGAVFLGTDPEERWSLQDFRAYAHPHFAAGKAWTYAPRTRNVKLGPAGSGIAWFDEVIDHARYGACRGTGVLQKVGGDWKLQTYSLSFLIPNAVAERATALAREAK
jgi:hypothetical protein